MPPRQPMRLQRQNSKGVFASSANDIVTADRRNETHLLSFMSRLRVNPGTAKQKDRPKAYQRSRASLPLTPGWGLIAPWLPLGPIARERTTAPAQLGVAVEPWRVECWIWLHEQRSRPMLPKGKPGTVRSLPPPQRPPAVVSIYYSLPRLRLADNCCTAQSNPASRRRRACHTSAGHLFEGGGSIRMRSRLLGTE